MDYWNQISELLKLFRQRRIQMKTKTGLTLVLLIVLILAGCEKAGKTFEISGSPDPLYYGCGASVFTFTVMGPGSGLRINSIVVAYQLFDGKGNKVKEATLDLHPIPYASPVAYDADRIITVPDSAGLAPAPDEPIIDFGEGRMDFAATVYATFLSPPPTGSSETYYFTSTKSVKVLPCTTPTLDPSAPPSIIIVTKFPPPPTAILMPEFTSTPTISPTVTPTSAPNPIPTKNNKPTPCGPNGCP
jgi:hypothetical protein